MTNKEFKKNYETITKELADISANGTINDLAAWYESNIKWATGFTSNQHEVIMNAYNAAYDTIRNRKVASMAQTEEKKVETKAVEETKPEVLKGEVVDTKEEKAVFASIEKVTKKIDTIGKGYIAIIGDVAKIKALKGWKYTGNKDFYELCAEKFGMARGTVSNLMKIFERYGDKETFKLTDECKDMGIREMLRNIESEKNAAIEDKGGDGDGDGNGSDKDSKKSKKPEVLVSIDFETVGDGWNAEAITKALAEQLASALSDITLGAGEKVQLTIAR